MRASKWLNVQALLDEDEMERLLRELKDISLFNAGIVTSPGEEKMGLSDFLKTYSAYVEALKNGKIPDSAAYRVAFSAAMTCANDHAVVETIGPSRQIVRIVKPVVQLQAHTFGFSELDRSFRPMIRGENAVSWGLQFSYPQLYENSVTKQAEKTLHDRTSFPNSAVFHSLQRWMRQETLPTPFVVDGQRTNSPIRIGKMCFPWINNHPQLHSKGIGVQI